MPNGNSEIPNSGEKTVEDIEKWLKTKRSGADNSPQKCPQECLLGGKSTENTEERFPNNVMDSMPLLDQPRAEISKRAVELYRKNSRYKEAVDLYHDGFSILSSIPAFREAVKDAQGVHLKTWRVVNEEARDKLERLRSGEQVPPYEMLDEILSQEEVKAQFKVGVYFYNVYVTNDSLRVERSSQPVSNKLSFYEDADEIKADRAKKDPAFTDEFFAVNVDNGADTPDIIIFNEPSRDYLEDNESNIVHHDYGNGQLGLDRNKVNPKEPINPSSIIKAKEILAELERGLQMKKYEETPDRDQRSQRYKTFNEAFNKALSEYGDLRSNYALREEDRRGIEAKNKEGLPLIKSISDKWKTLLSDIPEYKKEAQAIERVLASRPKKEGYVDNLVRIRAVFKRGNYFYQIFEVRGISLDSNTEKNEKFNRIQIRRSVREFPQEAGGFSFEDELIADEAVDIFYDESGSSKSVLGTYSVKEKRDYKIDPIGNQKDKDRNDSMLQQLQEDLTVDASSVPSTL